SRDTEKCGRLVLDSAVYAYHCISDPDARHTIAERLHPAVRFTATRIRKHRLVHERHCPFPDLEIDGIDARSRQTDEHFTELRNRDIYLIFPQIFRAAELVEANGFHANVSFRKSKFEASAEEPSRGDIPKASARPIGPGIGIIQLPPAPTALCWTGNP